MRIRARDSGQILFAGREQEDGRPPHGEEQFRAVAESVADGIVSISGSGEVIYFNPAAQLIFGYRPAMVLGSPFTFLMAERWQGTYEKAMSRFLARGRNELIGTTQEVEGRRRNGENFPAEIVLSPWTADGETFFTAVVRDITERKTLVQLEQSNSDLEQFAYLASHDLGEPLRTITSYVQLLDSRYGGCLGQDADDFIEFALQGTQRMQALIDSLLEYSRASSPEYELRSVDCSEVVHCVLALLRAKITDVGATVETRELPIVCADARQISRVFQNLITNALTYRREAPTVRIGAERVVGAWCFSVSDNGIGIAEADAGRVFEMLERLHTPQEYGGSGMGLAICKRIIERHGGRIWAEPNPEGGTTFCFTIPDPDSGSLDGRS